jgi:hypothetical protein
VSVEDMEVGVGDEYAISGREHKLDGVLDATAALASQAVARLRASGATKVKIEFGVEVALETGRLVAVLGRASTKSPMTASLEWDEAHAKQR